MRRRRLRIGRYARPVRLEFGVVLLGQAAPKHSSPLSPLAITLAADGVDGVLLSEPGVLGAPGSNLF